MPTIAIMGAGPGMGLAIAQAFGKERHQVALLSRTPANLDPVVAELTDQGIEAAAFAADVLDRPSIASGLAAVKQRFGQVDVLEYSPSNPALPLASSTELTHDNVQLQLDFYVHGAVAAVNQVLPEMLARGSGTILFTTGASSVRPEIGHGMFGNVAPAAAWLRNWAHGLHAAAAPRGVQVGHIAIGHGTWGRLGGEVGRRLHGRTDMTPHLIRGIGPTLIPRPQRMYLRFGPPIDTAAPDGVATEQWVATVKETAKVDLESTLADLLRVRETDPFRHLAPWAWQRAVMPAPPG